MRDDDDGDRRGGLSTGVIVAIVVGVLALPVLALAGLSVFLLVGVTTAVPMPATPTPVATTSATTPAAPATVPESAPPPAEVPGVAVTAKAGPKPKGDEPATPAQIIARLRDADEEIMRHFRRGQKPEGVKKLKDVVKSYEGKPPAKCEKDEALAVAVMRTRLLTLEADDMTDADLKAFLDRSQEYATRSGLTVPEWKDAALEVTRKTVLATK